MSDNLSFLSGLISELVSHGWFSAFAIILSSVAIWLALRSKSRIINLQHRVSLLQNEIRALNSGALGIGRKVHSVESELANAEFKISTSKDTTRGNKVYEQAAVLLERGATIEEVSNCCDLPPAEVELLAVMHHSGKAGRKNVTRPLH